MICRFWRPFDTNTSTTSGARLRGREGARSEDDVQKSKFLMQSNSEDHLDQGCQEMQCRAPVAPRAMARHVGQAAASGTQSPDSKGARTKLVSAEAARSNRTGRLRQSNPRGGKASTRARKVGAAFSSDSRSNGRESVGGRWLATIGDKT